MPHRQGGQPAIGDYGKTADQLESEADLIELDAPAAAKALRRKAERLRAPKGSPARRQSSTGFASTMLDAVSPKPFDEPAPAWEIP